MLSRALISATVMLLIGCFAADKAQAQVTNLEAGKSSAQIFAGTCTACHKSPRGLLRTVSPGSLPGFLRQHYTTSSDMAAPLSAYLISNGVSDTRAGTKQGRDAPSDTKPSGTAEQLDRSGHRLRPGAPVQDGTAKPEPQQAAKPDADGISPQAEPGGRGRNGKRLARPGEAPDATKPVAEDERGPDGRKGKLKLGKRGRPGSEEPPKTDAATGEPAASEPAKDKPKSEPTSEPKSDTAKDEGNKLEGVKSSGEAKSEPAKTDAPKAAGGGETPALRADPVPAVTPAPKTAEGEARPVQTTTPAPSGVPPAASTATAEPVPPPPAMTASAPPPVAPAGPPAPPISQ
jgi:hypothetical protein